MRSLLQSSIRSLKSLLRVVACVLSVAMLLSLVIAKSHNFGAHFRTPEVRRTTMRHTTAAHSYDSSCERVAHSNIQPARFAPIHLQREIIPLENFALASEVPLPRLLSRLKLNPAGSGGLDPLL
jgi:hypothetical protein